MNEFGATQDSDLIEEESSKMTNTGVPQQVSEIVFESMSELLESIRLVRQTCSPDDAVAYSKGARLIICQMGKILSHLSSIDPVVSPSPDKPLLRKPLVGNFDTAQRVAENIFQVSRRLTESLGDVRTALPEDQFKAYALGVGEALTEIMYEALNPIFAMHPSIEPKSWK